MESDDNQSNLSPQEFSDGDPPSFSGDEEGTFHQSSSDVEDSESYGEEYEQYAEQVDEDAEMYENQSEGGPPEVIEISDSSDAENESSAEPQEQYEIESNNGEEITPLEQEHEESQEDVEDQPEVETLDQSHSSSKEYENEPQPEEHFQKQEQHQQSEEPILTESSETVAAVATPRRITRSMTGSISPVRPISSVSPGQRRQSVERGVSQSPSASGERGRRTGRGRTRSSHGSELENDDESRGPSESQISQISVDMELAEDQQAPETQQIPQLLQTEEGESSSHQEAGESHNVQSKSILGEEVHGDNREDVTVPQSPSKLTTAELLSSFPELSADLTMEEDIRSNQFRMEDLITIPPEQGEASIDQPKSRSRSPQRSVQAQPLQRSPSPKKAMDIDEPNSPTTQSATEPNSFSKDSTSRENSSAIATDLLDNSGSMSPLRSSSPERHLVENIEEEYVEEQPTTRRAPSQYQAMVVDSPKVRTSSPRRQVAQLSSGMHLQDESQNPQDSNPTIPATLQRTPSPVRIQQRSQLTSMDVDEELTIPMNESSPQSNVISNLCAILDIPSSTYLGLLDPRNSHIQDTPEAIMNLFVKMEKILSQSVLNTNREAEEPATEGSVSEDIAELRAQITELKSEKAVLEVNFEHTTHGHLSTINSLREQIHQMQTELDHFKNEMEKSDKTVAELKQNLAHERDVKERREVELNKLKSRIEGLESEKRDIVRRLGKGIEGKDDYDNLLSRHISLKTENEKLSSELNEYRARQVSIELQRQKMEQELKILTDQNDWLSSELKEKTEEFGQYRKEKSSALLSLQSQVDSLTTQSLSHTQTISHLRTQLSNLQQTHTQTLNELDSLRSQLVSQEADYKSALDTATRSSNLYKTHAEDLQAKVEEMRQISTQLENAVNDKYLELDTKDATIENLRKELEEATKKLTDVTKELEGIKRRGFVSAAESDTTTLSAFSPTAETWKQMQESGQSVTDMRERIRSLDRGLQDSEAERKRLEGLLTRVMSEIEERVPEMAETSNRCASLEKELEEYKRKEREDGVHRKELDKLRKEHELLKVQYERMDRDLSLQIQALVQGNFTEAKNHPIADFESSEDVITNRLLIFRNIEELQTQNKNLLKALRAAMARLEEVESPLETTQDMYNQINRLKEELTLSQQRVASMSNQQEVLRSQLSGRGSVAGSPSPMRTFSRSISPARELELDRERENLKKKEHEFENMKRDLRVNEKMLKDQIDQLRTECGDLRVALAKEKARSDGLLERYNLITSQFETQTHDLATHQTLTSTLQSQLNTAESKLTNLTSENISLQTQLTKINSELSNLQSEKKLWKSIEVRLERERSEGQKEKERLSKVVEGWGRIQSEFERRMENEKSRWEERVKSLEDELDQTKSKLIESSTELKMISERRDLETNESKSKIESLTSDLAESQQKLVLAQSNLQHYTTRISDLTKQLKTVEEKLAVHERRKAEAAVAEGGVTKEQLLESEVEDLRAEIESTKAKLALTQSHVTEYENLAKSAEQNLAAVSSSYDEYKTQTESLLATKQSQVEDLRAKLTDLSNRLDESAQEIASLHTQMDVQQAEYTSRIKSLESTLQIHKDTETRTSEQIEHLKKDLDLQTQLAKESQSRYQRELMTHADDVRLLSQVKEQLIKLKNDATTFEKKAESAEEMLRAKEASWTDERKMFEENMKELEKRCSEYTDQNNLLHTQLESLSAQVEKLQSSSIETLGATSSDIGAVTEKDKTIRELREVIKHVRREKEIVQCNFDMASQELKKLKQQLDVLHKELDNVRGLLAEAQSSRASLASSQQAHTDLLAKVNELNILRESNATLREESERHKLRVKDLQAQVAQLRIQIEPMKAKIGDLEAEISARCEEIEQLKADNTKWKERNSSLLSKYDRIDPAEHHKLQEERDQLVQERVEWVKEKETIEAEYDRKLKDNSKKQLEFREKALARVNAQKKKIEELTKLTEELHEKVKTLEGEKSQLENQLQTLKSQSTQTSATQDSALSQMEAERDQLTERNRLLVEKFNKLLRDFKQLRESNTTNERNWKEAKARVEELESSLVEALESVKEANRKASEWESRHKRDTATLEMKNSLASSTINSNRKKLQELQDRIAELEGSQAEKDTPTSSTELTTVVQPTVPSISTKRPREEDTSIDISELPQITEPEEEPSSSLSPRPKRIRVASASAVIMASASISTSTSQESLVPAETVSQTMVQFRSTREVEMTNRMESEAGATSSTEPVITEVPTATQVEMEQAPVVTSEVLSNAESTSPAITPMSEVTESETPSLLSDVNADRRDVVMEDSENNQEIDKQGESDDTEAPEIVQEFQNEEPSHVVDDGTQDLVSLNESLQNSTEEDQSQEQSEEAYDNAASEEPSIFEEAEGEIGTPEEGEIEELPSEAIEPADSTDTAGGNDGAEVVQIAEVEGEEGGLKESDQRYESMGDKIDSADDEERRRAFKFIPITFDEPADKPTTSPVASKRKTEATVSGGEEGKTLRSRGKVTTVESIAAAEPSPAAPTVTTRTTRTSRVPPSIQNLVASTIQQPSVPGVTAPPSGTTRGRGRGGRGRGSRGRGSSQT